MISIMKDSDVFTGHLCPVNQYFLPDFKKFLKSELLLLMFNKLINIYIYINNNNRYPFQKILEISSLYEILSQSYPHRIHSFSPIFQLSRFLDFQKGYRGRLRS